MLKVDRSKFWKGYHRAFGHYGPVTQPTVDGLNYILDRFEKETRLSLTSHFSYILATAYHESGRNGHHFVPVREGRERPDSPRRANQDKYWLTGYYGRGLIQTTHKDNYLELGQDLGQGDLFVKEPDLLLTKEWSYESLVHGMVKGIYRSDARPKNLSRYLKDDTASVREYTVARDIVNGDIKKNGLLIAGYADAFELIILVSAFLVTDSDQPGSIDNTAHIPPVVPPSPPTDQTGGLASQPVANESPSFNPTVITQYIPKMKGIRNWLGTLGIGGIISTTYAAMNGLPVWVVFLLGMLTMAIIIGLVVIVIKYRQSLFDLVKHVITVNADPNTNMVQLVSSKEPKNSWTDYLPSINDEKISITEVKDGDN